MKLRIQVTIEHNDEPAETITEEIIMLMRQPAANETLGLTLAESKDIPSL